MTGGPWTRALWMAVLLLVFLMTRPGPAGAASSGHDAHQSTATSSADHHRHPTPTPEETAYSVFMHHAAGVGLLLIGALVLADRLTGRRYSVFTKAIGLTWIGLGVFLFIRSDPEAWPMGPSGFIESFFIPTTSEWVQHKVLSMIPMFMGMYVIKGGGQPVQRIAASFWNYAAAGLAILGAVALLVHMHIDHPDQADVVNSQHRLFAINALFIAAGLVLDMRKQFQWKFKPYLLPIGLLLLAYQLFIYVE